MDDKCVGQGIFRECREVGLGQQGLQSLEHIFLTGQTLGIRKGWLVQGLPVRVDGVIQGLRGDNRKDREVTTQGYGPLGPGKAQSSVCYAVFQERVLTLPHTPKTLCSWMRWCAHL